MKRTDPDNMKHSPRLSETSVTQVLLDRVPTSIVLANERQLTYLGSCTQFEALTSATEIQQCENIERNTVIPTRSVEHDRTVQS